MTNQNKFMLFGEDECDVIINTPYEQLSSESIYTKYNMLNVIKFNNEVKSINKVKSFKVSCDKIYEDILNKYKHELKDGESQASDIQNGIMNIISKT